MKLNLTRPINEEKQIYVIYYYEKNRETERLPIDDLIQRVKPITTLETTANSEREALRYAPYKFLSEYKKYTPEQCREKWRLNNVLDLHVIVTRPKGYKFEVPPLFRQPESEGEFDTPRKRALSMFKRL